MLDAMASYRSREIHAEVKAPPFHFARDGEIPNFDNLLGLDILDCGASASNPNTAQEPRRPVLPTKSFR